MGRELPITPRLPSALDAEALALFFFEERRQPAGLAGVVDWWLAGRLARLVFDGTFSGRAGEALMTTTLGRIGPRRLFLLGLGPRGQAEAAIDASLRGQLAVLSAASPGALAVAAPERSAPAAALLERALEELLPGARLLLEDAAA
jgi:hypothetical protein